MCTDVRRSACTCSRRFVRIRARVLYSVVFVKVKEGRIFGVVSLLTLYNFEEANLLLFTTFRKNLRFGEAERAHIQ